MYPTREYVMPYVACFLVNWVGTRNFSWGVGVLTLSLYVIYVWF